MTSSNRGQNALLQLPTFYPTSGHNGSYLSLTNYQLSDNLAAVGKSEEGLNAPWMEVLKVSKTGKLQTRKIAISSDHRNLCVTTNRIKTVKGLLRYALQTTRESSTPRVIDISAIDHMQCGQHSKKFLLAKISALSGSSTFANANSSDDERILLSGENRALSIVYRIAESVVVSSTTSSAENIATIAVFPSSKQNKRLHHFETLDLVIANDQDYRTLVATLQDLIRLHQLELARYDRSVSFLQYHWFNLEKPLDGKIGIPEWIVMCERMNVPLLKTDLTTIYKKYEKNVDEDAKEDDTGRSFQIVGELMEQVENVAMLLTGFNKYNHDPLDRLWNEILITDPIPVLRMARADDDASVELEFDEEEEEETISSVAFLSFIRSQQKEYHTSLEYVANLIHILNNKVTFDDLNENGIFDLREKTNTSSLDRLSKSRFISFLTSDTNDLLDPSKAKVGADDMTRPLSHYWISTSHDTYLKRVSDFFETSTSCANTGMVDADEVDEQMFFVALYRGARCLELDIWDGISNQPVISRKQPSSTEKTIPLAVVLKIVRSFLQNNPNSYPIILHLENHCSFKVQQKIANQIQDILGLTGLLARSNVSDEQGYSDPLPSPAALKGKALVMGKRPMSIVEGAKVMHDDFDDDNDNDSVDDEYEASRCNGTSEIVPPLTPDLSGKMASTTGYNDGELLSPGEFLKVAQLEAEAANEEATNAKERVSLLKAEAAEAEIFAARLTKEVGLSASEMKQKAAFSNQKDDFIEGVEVKLNFSTCSSPKDEGIEVQEFLQDEVRGSNSRYSDVISEAIEASESATICLAKLRHADAALKEADTGLQRNIQKEKDLAEVARRAETEARSNHEYAKSAKSRVETVKELWKKCQDNVASASTVVVTATTEATISERRAAESESRASRTQVIAERERTRADEETRKEEKLEKEVSELHEERNLAANVTHLAMERVDKASTMLERVNQQIIMIENTTQFKKEVQENPNYRMGEASPNILQVCHYIKQHLKKLEEREMCKNLIKEASREHSKAEGALRKVQESFEGKAQMWKVQVDHASIIRRQADRSALVAEECNEHAEEERDAASLRLIGKERAEGNVQQQNSYRDSVKAQLSEAERAAAQALSIRNETRNRADKLSQSAEKVYDNSAKIRIAEQCKFIRDEAHDKYEKARAKKEKADAVAANTKRILETNTEVYNSAVRDAAEENSRVHAERLAEQKSIVAFNRAILTRKQADHAIALSKIASATAKDRSMAMKRAKNFKEKSDKVFEIPVELASLTWLHTVRHKYWEKTLTLPSNHVLSLSKQTISSLLSKNPKKEAKHFYNFSRTHLCRLFPSRKTLKNAKHLNHDPVFPWSLGCQLVSMNYFSHDENLIVADGRFRQNGSCGYVLKPSTLTAEVNSISEKPQRWTINILRGFKLPKSETRRKGNLSNADATNCNTNPYVQISLKEGDMCGKEIIYTTDTVKNNGLNPIWNDQVGFSFVSTKPSIAMLVFSVWNKIENHSDGFIGAAALPLSCIREGYRSVAFLDANASRNGPYAYASLFIRSQKVSS